jgi:hypothetical protein
LPVGAADPQDLEDEDDPYLPGRQPILDLAFSIQVMGSW